MNTKLNKLIKRDFVVGFSKNKYKFLLVILIFTIFFIGTYISLKNGFIGQATPDKKVRFIDLVFNIFKGDIKESKEIPVSWLLINVYVCYLIGSHCYDDVSKESSHLIVKMTNRKYIWLSKIIWMIGTILTFYAILFAIIFAISAIGGNLSLDISHIKLMYEDSNINCSGWQLLLSIIGLYILVSIAISTLQMFLTLAIKPSYMYVVISCILTLSITTKSYILPSQSTLILRQHMMYNSSNMNIQNSVVYNVILFIIVFIIGLRFIQKYDILSSETTD